MITPAEARLSRDVDAPGRALDATPESAGRAPSRGRRVALLHYWVVHVRGGEAAFFEMARAIPEADLFFLHYRPELIPPDLRHRVAGASFLQHRPFRALPYRALLPLLPRAVDSLDLSDYDLVLSSSAGWTHGARPAPQGTRLTYAQSWPR